MEVDRTEHRICLNAGLANTFSSHKGKVMAVAVCHGVQAIISIIGAKLSCFDAGFLRKAGPDHSQQMDTM